MDYTNAKGADSKSVEDRLHEGQMSRVVVASRVYPTDREDLWNALTDLERIPRWFSPVTGDLQLGGQFQVENNAGGKILTCVPPESFDVTWEFGGQVSWVCVRLTEEGEKTRLKLEHIIPKDPQAEEHWKKYGPGATGVGWDLAFWGMALHCEIEGGVFDKDAVMAWLGTDDGKAFMRAMAEEWGAAHKTSGEEADVADTMAKNTGDAYTGA